MLTLREIANELGLTYYQTWYRLHRFNIPHTKRGKTFYADLADFFYLPVHSGYPRKRAQRSAPTTPDMFLL